MYNELYDFYVTTGSWSSLTKIILIELGFVHLLIHENVFLGCNHILTANSLFKREDYLALVERGQRNPLLYRRKLITAMNTPEKMKIFLDFYPSVDLNELIGGNTEIYQQRTPLTVFDRLLKMEPFFYETNDSSLMIDQPDFTSSDENIRTANILSLFQRLIERGARVRFN